MSDEVAKPSARVSAQAAGDRLGRQLSVVVPSYNACTLLRRTLRALLSAVPEAEVIVVDGRSPDQSADMVRREFPEVRLVEQQNFGFGHAVNRGIEVTSRPYILLLNSDLFVTHGALQAMHVRLIADPKVGVVAPVLLNEDGSRQRVFGAYYWPNWVEIRTPTRVPWVSGACVMTTREVIDKVGGLDENLFLYNEEYDWCWRVTRAGFTLEMIPERVIHVGGGSTRRSPDLAREEYRGFAYFVAKHAPKTVTTGVQVAMVAYARLLGTFDPRPDWRRMWSQLATQADPRAGTESLRQSPFPLSGRGEATAQANGVRPKTTTQDTSRYQN